VLLIVGTAVFLLIALNNAYGFRLFVGGIVSIAAWRSLGQTLVRHGSAPVTVALVGGWTGFVSAGTNLVLREWLRITGEVPGIDGQAGHHLLVAGVPTALLYWTAFGALVSLVPVAFRAFPQAGWVEFLVFAALSCGAFAMASSFMRDCGQCL
jgi:hypothetical protein